MSNAAIAAIDQAQAAARRTHGLPVTYERDEDSVELNATIGATVFELDQGDDIAQRIESRDYLIPAAELILDSLTVLPAAGDRILETVGAQVKTYEVIALPGEPAYRFSDPYHRSLRIHTKHVKTESV